MTSEQRDFFISFTSTDRPWAEWVTFQLKRKGYTVYYQNDDFPPGCDFIQQMNFAMSNTKLTIALWTDNYFTSGFASLEGRTAFNQSILKKEIKLVPVLVEDCSIDPLFATLSYINLVGKKDEVEVLKLLLGGINAALSIGKSGSVKMKPPFPGKSYDEKVVSTKTGFSIPSPFKVLYAGSKRSSTLDLESSYTTIATGIKKHISKRIIKLDKELNLNTSNIFDIILKHQPDVFHFSGKQDEGDIRITDEDGNLTTVSDIELSGYLTSFGDKIKLAVIDTCHSLACARSVSEVVDFAIGVQGSIYDVDADKYFKVFYNALCSGHCIKDAVGQATACLKFQRTPTKEIPVLFSKKTADPSKSYFTPP